MSTYKIRLIKTKTEVSVAEITVNADNESDALVLAKYKDVPSYCWERDYDADKETQTTREVKVVGEEVPA